MNVTIPLVNGYSMDWRPAVVSRQQQTPPLGKASLGQRSFVESPVLSLITDGIILVTSGYIGWGISLQQKKLVMKAAEAGKVTTLAASNWATFWFVLAAAAGVKLLHDISRV